MPVVLILAVFSDVAARAATYIFATKPLLEGPPVIVAQTPSQVVLLGNPATFSVRASGSDPLSYFWQSNGVPISGATNFSYTLANSHLSDSGGKFSCLVTNAFGSARSTNASLKVIDTIANDLCSDAIVINSATYTNVQSTLKASSFGDPAPDCVEGFGHGVWYQFTAPVTGLLIVDTIGSDFDTGLAIYTGSCDALTEVACDDDTGGSATSQVTLPTTAGTAYFILAGGYSSDAGNLILHLSHLTPPAFDVQPTNLAVVVSSNAIFNPALSGTLPMSFQWYYNSAPLTDGERISGSTNSTLTLANVQTNDAGIFQLVASNIVGAITSSAVVLTPVILPPVFVQAPANQSVSVGSNATFSATVAGTPPYSYQWNFNGTPLADDSRINGSTTLNLSIFNLTTADAGGYSLTVTNVSGSVNTAATLVVMAPPSVTLQPTGRSVPPGLPTIFTASASGIPAPSYQWQLNGTNISGATSKNYTNPAVGIADLGFYHVVCSNAVGSTTSADAQLTFGNVAAWGSNLQGESLPPPGLSNVISLAGSDTASFAVLADGSVVCWGDSFETGILADVTNAVAISVSGSANAATALRPDGTVVGRGVPLPPPTLSNIVSTAWGDVSFGLALRAEGTVTGWGTLPYSTIPAGLNHVTAIACGYQHSLALRSDGTVVAWGAGAATNVPSGLANVTAIAAGYLRSLALKADGTVVAWGSGTATNLPPGLTNIVAISARDGKGSFSLALRSNGTVVAWGDNVFGETNPPTALSNLVSVAVVAACNHGLSLVNNGSPQIVQQPVGLTAYAGRSVTLHGSAIGASLMSYQWLLNGLIIPGATNSSLTLPNIQLSDSGLYQLSASNAINTAISLRAPVNVISNNNLVILSQTSVLTSNVYQGGTAKFYGGTVLGNGPLRYQWFSSSTNKNYLPVANATNDTLILDPALSVQSGNYYLAFSNLVGGVTSAPANVTILFARAWGFQSVTNPPINITNAIAVATGGHDNYYGDYFALGADGKLTSWGNYLSSYGATNVSALSNSFVTAIASGWEDSLALKSDGTVYAWGINYYGQTNVPAGLSGVTAIACGDYHDLALKADGTVAAWGQNIYGQATNYAAATNVVAIAAGGQNSMALRADGSVVTWGYYGSGQYPIPTTATNVIAIACGTQHLLALRADGRLISWGYNYYGPPTSIPADLTNIVAISASANHSTFLRADGTVVSIGYEYGAYISNNVTADLANVIRIASGGDHDFALFGTRAPSFTIQPWNRSIPATATTNITLAAKCAGAQPIRYQWQLNGTNISGATNDTLSLGGRTITGAPISIQAGAYQLIASNAYGVLASKYAKVTTFIPLGDAVDTTNQGWTTSGNAQWFGQTNVTHDGVDAAQSGGIGALQETILQTTLATNVAGNCTFWWKVSSELDFDFLEFRINGVMLASISGEVNWQQVSIPVAAGTNILQWRYSKDSSYDAGQDACWVDQFAFAPSPVISSQPSSITSYAGTTVHFSVYLSGQSPLGYQWQKNGVKMTNGGNVSGTTTPYLSLSNIQDADAASYTVLVTNSLGGSVTSSTAMLTILDGSPIITGQPSSCTNLGGTMATFSGAAIGTTPLGCQWQFNGTNLDGATNSLLALKNVRTGNAGTYQIVVTNAWGSVTSSIATLTVVRSRVVAWGDNNSGQSSVPFGLTDVVAIAGGDMHSLALKTDGTMVVWGDDGYDQTNVPTGLTNVAAIAAGGCHSLALQNNGSIVAWGYDVYGENNVPASLRNVTAIAAGYYHSFALKSDGMVAAWGYNDDGETDWPAGLTNVVAIAGGRYYSLALQANGTVMAWGNNGYGQTSVPAELTNLLAIAGGGDHSLALQANGTVVAWGDNRFGQTDVPAGLTSVVAIAGGNYYSLALQSNGTVVAWGDNYSNVPTGLTNVVAIAGGGYHSLAIQNDGSPFIARQPWNQTTLTNTTVVFAVAAMGTPSLGYQWQKNGSNLMNGSNISGSTTASLTLSNVQSADMASYAVVITNTIDSITSSPATLTVIGPPSITVQPLSQSVMLGSNLQFDVTALGYPSPAYQWWQNGTNPVGGNSPVLILSNVSRAQNGIYSVVVTNGNGLVVSSNAVGHVSVPQRLGLPKLLSDGSFQLTSGDADCGQITTGDLANFETQVSTNLVNWVTMPDGLSLTNGTLQLQDKERTNSPVRFYRIIEH